MGEISMKRTLLGAVATTVLSVTSAFGLTVGAGETWEGAYDLSAADTTSIFPIVSVDGPITFQQYYAFISSALDVGEDLTIELYDSSRILLGSSTFEPTTTPFSGNAGLGGSYDGIISTGFVRVSSISGGFSLDFLQVAGIVPVTVDHPTLGDFSTAIQARDSVTDWTLVVDDPDGGTVVPLPASAWLLVGAFAGMVGLRRRTRKPSM